MVLTFPVGQGDGEPGKATHQRDQIPANNQGYDRLARGAWALRVTEP